MEWWPAFLTKCVVSLRIARFQIQILAEANIVGELVEDTGKMGWPFHYIVCLPSEVTVSSADMMGMPHICLYQVT